MNHKSTLLEEKLNKPDWKQWMPLYGFIQICKDGIEGKKTLLYEDLDCLVFSAVQATSVGAVYTLVYPLIEKLF